MGQIAIDCRSEPRRLAKPRPIRNHIPTASGTRLFLVLEAAFAIDHGELCAATRGRSDIAFARQAGMYLARVVLGMTLSDAGFLFGRDRTTASHACRVIEDLRDDPGLDALLDAMEAFLVCSDVQSRRVRR